MFKNIRHYCEHCKKCKNWLFLANNFYLQFLIILQQIFRKDATQGSKLTQKKFDLLSLSKIYF